MAQDTPPYSKVHAILSKHCFKCHNAEEPEGELQLDKYESLVKGGENGPVFKAGDADGSTILQSVEHRKKPYMPPPKKGEKLSEREVAVLRAWIVGGAPGPKPGEVLTAALEVPKIAPKVAPRKGVLAAVYDPKSKLLALGKPGEVELRSAETRAGVRKLAGPGQVNDLAFLAGGTRLAAAGGEAGLGGEVRIFNVADGALVRTLTGHKDAVYAVAASPDGKLLATGSYDPLILLWDLGSGKVVRELKGHNEAVFDVAFRPDGRILASASADRTVKLWDVATGERRDTLSESTKALHAVAFSPDGGEVAAAGVDNRVRVWKVSADAREGTNAIRGSQFAHEGAILGLRYSADGKTILTSADDRSVKLSNAADLTPRVVVEAQPDWPAAVAFALDDKAVVVGRLDGSVGFYDASSGKPLAPPKPEGSMIEPRGVKSGAAARVRVSGKNLAEIAAARTGSPKVKAEVDEAKADAVWLKLSAEEGFAGPVEVWVSGPGGEAGPLKVWVDTLPQVAEKEPNDTPGGATELEIPASVWGSVSRPGDSDHFAFEGRKGQILVIDAAARRLGAKPELALTLLDAGGRVLASNLEFEGDADPAVVHALPADGWYVVRVGDLQLAASGEHFYRISIGALPLVTGILPIGVPANAESEVRLVGVNLPGGASVRVKAGAPGEVTVPIDPGLRPRREFRVVASGMPEALESEPNDRAEQATRIAVPGAANGRIGRDGDADLYRFEAKAGQAWVIETLAAQRGSPVDTRIQVLRADGKPVERLLLRAVRDSSITFRPIDANSGGVRLPNWEEMDLNQYLYIRGEVVRLFLAPRGPDSEWGFFLLNGKRKCYFDTSATSHPLDETCYIVDPHPPGTQMPSNGLPVFPVNYANDDDGDRKLGSDSRLIFTAPADGTYLVRVTDVRGAGGDRWVYRLMLREARPDFAVTLEGANGSVPSGSGRGFTVRVDRIDGFDGPVRVDVTGLPEGFAATTPVTVEAGLYEAKGTLWAAAEAPKPAKEAAVKLAATGRGVTREAGTIAGLSVAPKPTVRVYLEPLGGAREIAVVPGQEVKALLKIDRGTFKDRVSFDVENLPFGVIVADIGLSGVLIPEKESEREIFLQCAAWVAPQDRPCHARAREVGNPTSKPVTFRVLR